MMPDATCRVQKSGLEMLQADWPVAGSVQAFSTTRCGGVSRGRYAGLNLATHVGDDARAVAHNRRRLADALRLPGTPHWLNQVHSDVAIGLPCQNPVPDADASYTGQRGQVCVVMTADCLPVLVSNRQGSWVAAIHAGWRGLASRIISKTLRQYPGNNGDLLVWLGPAISAAHYEVDNHVRAPFLAMDARYDAAFKAQGHGHYLLDVYRVAQIELAMAGIPASNIYGGGACSYENSTLFYSYRRDGANTGRMASLIWIDAC